MVGLMGACCGCCKENKIYNISDQATFKLTCSNLSSDPGEYLHFQHNISFRVGFAFPKVIFSYYFETRNDEGYLSNVRYVNTEGNENGWKQGYFPGVIYYDYNSAALLSSLDTTAEALLEKMLSNLPFSNPDAIYYYRVKQGNSDNFDLYCKNLVIPSALVNISNISGSDLEFFTLDELKSKISTIFLSAYPNVAEFRYSKFLLDIRLGYVTLVEED